MGAEGVTQFTGAADPASHRVSAAVEPGGYSVLMQDQDDADGNELELIRPEDLLARSAFPPDAQRMGIDRWSDDAGMIAIASSLDPGKLSHKILAWVMLVALTCWLLGILWLELS